MTRVRTKQSVGVVGIGRKSRMRRHVCKLCGFYAQELLYFANAKGLEETFGSFGNSRHAKRTFHRTIYLNIKSTACLLRRWTVKNS